MGDYKYYTPVALLDALLEYIPDKQVENIVDISCGPFNLLKSALKKYPNAKCIGVDIEDQDVKEYSEICFVKQDGRIFSKEQHARAVTFDLILTNPPFGRLKKEDRLFEDEPNAELCSRYECEMMYANSLLAQEGSYMIAILPATFVEGDLYLKYRKKLAKDYEIRQLIKLPGNVFSKGDISAYAIIFYRTDAGIIRDTQIGNAIYKDSKWIVSCGQTVAPTDIMRGSWVTSNLAIVPKEKKEIGCIYRGNISSTYFSADGDEILHCSSIFQHGAWIPLLCHCKDYPKKNVKCVHDGDIIVNRIGKNAGFWTKYAGERRLVSDCLIVVQGGTGIEEYLKQYSTDGRLEIPLKGVATKYISISDLLSFYFIKQATTAKGEKTN